MSFVGTDRFKVIRLLGSGSMGMCILVFDRQLAQRWRLKLLDGWTGWTCTVSRASSVRWPTSSTPTWPTGCTSYLRGAAVWYFTMEYVAGVPFDTYLLCQGRQRAVRTVRQVEPATPPHRHSAKVRFRPQPDGQRLRITLQQLCAGVHAMHGPAASTAISSRRTCW